MEEVKATNLAETEDAPDEGGMTRKFKLESLMRARTLYASSQTLSPPAALQASNAFMAKCAVTILWAQGRADYGDPAELERLGGFSVKPPTPDHYAIAADRALFIFEKGEFPAYDEANRLYLEHSSTGSTPGPSNEQLAAQESLFHETLLSLGVTPLETEGE